MATKQKLELTWIGKEKRARLEPRILIEVPEKSHHAATRRKDGKNNFDNMLIHGDNLLALKALEQKCIGRVKCIYIDPPYNTGSAFAHYEDGIEHSIWLGLMRERLELLYRLLSEDGSIWISIDDREEAYLKVMCDELFGRDNFVSNIAWQRTYSTRNDAKGIVNEVEHILVYSKNPGWRPNLLPRTIEMNDKYKNPDNDIEPWKSTDALAPDSIGHQGMVYAIQNPITGKLIYPTPGRHWASDQLTILESLQGWAAYELRDIDDEEERARICGTGIDDVRKGVKAIVLSQSVEKSRKSAELVLSRGQWPKYYFMKEGKGGLARKTYISSVGGVAPTNLFEYKDVGHTDEAKKEILALFKGKAPFDTPKPERLIQRILTIATNEGDLVLDSFLGSGTTAAVAHKMGRRWIGVELGDHCYTLCQPRLTQVVDGEQGGISKAVNWKGGGGFQFFELAETLVTYDQWGQPVINKNFNAEMLSRAVCKLEGFEYAPSKDEYFIHGHSSERSFIYVTTSYMRSENLRALSEQIGTKRTLLICCRGFETEVKFRNLTVKKIPKAVLDKCEWGHDDYSLNVRNLPISDEPAEIEQGELF